MNENFQKHIQDATSLELTISPAVEANMRDTGQRSPRVANALVGMALSGGGGGGGCCSASIDPAEPFNPRDPS